MDTTNDIAEFPTSRRARITPEQAGLPTYGKRRVPGLRREEVASLAGVSIDYYKRLERGKVSGVSDSRHSTSSRGGRPRPRDTAGVSDAENGRSLQDDDTPAHELAR
jgi:hypothetical protein